MSNIKHTTEPWEVVLSEDGDELHIQSKDGMVAKVDRFFLCNSEEKTHEANAQRIVDCVNACAGIEKFPLLGFKEQIDIYQLHIASLIHELTKASKAWKEQAESVGESGLLEEDDVYQDMLRAIETANSFIEKEVTNG